MSAATYPVLRLPHRTFLFWALLVMVLTSVAVGAIGLQRDGFTAGTVIRVVFVLVMVAFFWGVFRGGTTVDEEGMTLRRGILTRRVPWDRVEGLGTDQPGTDARRVTAQVDGGVLVLPGVLVSELDQLERVGSAARREA